MAELLGTFEQAVLLAVVHLDPQAPLAYDRARLRARKAPPPSEDPAEQAHV